MTFLNFLRRPPKLSRILSKPADFESVTIAKAVVDACAGNYNQPPDKLLFFRSGTTSSKSSLAEIAGLEVAEAIHANSITEEKVAKGRFMQLFDNALVRLFKAQPRQAVRIENFMESAFRSYLHATDYRQICPVHEDRLVAYAEAVGDFFQAIREEDFNLNNSAAAFFQRIYRNKCVSVVRKVTSEKYRANRNFVDLVLEQLPEDAVNKLRQPPHNMYAFDLETIRKLDQDCFHLLYLRFYEDYSFPDIGELLARTVKKVRGDLDRCLKKYRSVFNNSNNDLANGQ